MRMPKLSALVFACVAIAAQAASPGPEAADAVVDGVMRPLMREHGIPGMSVAITINGRDRIYHYGIASKDSGAAVTDSTLFEIGSVSKTFTAVLAAHAEARGVLALSESPSAYLPALRGTALDQVTLLQLATHTGGGLPLQVPDAIGDDESLQAYFHAWRPASPPGGQRVYSNLGTGLLGMATAAASGEPFETAVERRIFRPLGMQSSFFQVPDSRRKDYAQGYTKQDAPIRLRPGMFWAEAYGVRSNAADLLRFVKAHMPGTRLDPPLRQAVAAVQQARHRAGELGQGLVWETYPWPATLDRLLAGNADAMVYDAVEAEWIGPARRDEAEVVVNKTGSTNGFAAYVAFVPSRRLGIVMLANRNYPAAARIRAAHAVLTALDARDGNGRGR
ncbi:class C beta-lactamase [Noviherbaspirillum aridicola]|uniref:Beta-lactamase n=1 Tax=Noviherbaspirillum aridicola TaxID=2849687 RepID=A0ABQ4PZX2_9BURK|nr:class C beta-lactamase [Noviherbaspirillum aridicola]GIZ50366.1 beta-lactamase [Noviherbaspirillum aridicola]